MQISPAELTLRQAIFFSEHPTALSRDLLPEHLDAVCAAMDRLFAAAREEQPLEWQAYQARCHRRRPLGASETARRVVAWQALGGLVPELPPLRS
jgi:hypothetical protein